jgi:osmotically-inducible protein OsmY
MLLPLDPIDHLSGRGNIALRSSGYRHLGNLECEVRDDLVILTGMLPSFYLKQVAQTIAMGVDQVREVRNVVEVDPN